MSILNTVNKSPFERNALESCLKFANAGDPVLLFEDGVYAVLKLSLIHISEPTRPVGISRMPSSA